MPFAALHMHSEFSARDSLLKISDLPRLAAEKGYQAVALTDHGRVEGVVPFLKACREFGVQAIPGIEFYVGIEDQPKAKHLTVLAKNAKGFGSILRVLHISHALNWDSKLQRAVTPIKTLLNGLRDCVILSGCANSPFWRGGSEAIKDLEAFVDAFKEDFFFEVQPLWDWSGQEEVNKIALESAKYFNRPLVGTGDCHYMDALDQEFHEGLLAIGSGYPIGSAQARRFSTKLNYLMGPEEFVEGLAATGLGNEAAMDALVGTELARERIEPFKWEDLPAPVLPVTDGDFRMLTLSRAKAKGLLIDPKYADRINEELKVFGEAGLGNYFLTVLSCIERFRKEGAFVGPRGSVGGSLVAYVLGIAELDPVKHGLPWQRFYAPGRSMKDSPPDIDSDISPSDREKVPDLLRSWYGEDRVAQLSTYGTFGVRTAVRDAAKAYAVDIFGGFKDWQEDLDDEEDIEGFGLYQQIKEKSPKAAEFARRLLGRVRQFGAHPGGFVITTDPISEGRGAIVNRGKGKALLWDLSAAAELGYIKIDFLGNDALSSIKAVTPHITEGWDKIDLDDPETLQDFGEGRTAGVPQFHTSGLRMFCEALRPQSFAELMWANAAYRPGALGMMSPRELVSAYRENPDSIIVYQEEVMNLCVELAGFSWAEADAVRKIIAKKKGLEELEKLRPRFLEGCDKKGVIDAEGAIGVFDAFSTFPKYSFPMAHTAAYTLNAVRIAWAKRHRSLPTFAALLNVELGKDPKKEQSEQILDELPDYGIVWKSAHNNLSGMEWVVEGDCLRAPLQMLPGADLRIAKAILKRRQDKGEFKNTEDFRKRMGKIKYPEEIGFLGFEERSAYQFLAPVENPGKEGEKIRQEVRECERCELRATCRSPVPPEYGKTNVLIVGESPGKWEDRHGRPFIGRSGKLLSGVLERLGIDRKDVSWTNALSCQPPYTEGEPTWEDVCPWVGEQVGRLRPPLVLAVGRRAWQRLGGVGGILKANATTKEGLPLVVACVHPAAVLRDAALLPELERACRKFARLYKELIGMKS